MVQACFRLGTVVILSVMTTLGGVQPANAKSACEPKIRKPSDHDFDVTLTPTITHNVAAGNSDNCHISEIRWQLWERDGQIGKRVYSHKETGNRILTRWNPGGGARLKPNTRYRIEVRQKAGKHILGFNKATNTYKTDEHIFYTKGGVKQIVCLKGGARSGSTSYTFGGDAYTYYLPGKIPWPSRHCETASRNGNDKLTQDGKVSGSVAQGNDRVLVSGDLEHFSMQDPQATDLFIDADRSHVLVFVGTQGSKATSFQFEMTGKVQQVEGDVAGTSLSVQPSTDTARGASAKGQVSTGADGFVVGGEFEKLDIDLATFARLELNGLEAHTVIIDGDSSAGTDYTIAGPGRAYPVREELMGQDVSFDNADSVDDTGTAHGRVKEGADGYIVTGDEDLISVSLDQSDRAEICIDRTCQPYTSQKRPQVDPEKLKPGPAEGIEELDLPNQSGD